MAAVQHVEAAVREDDPAAGGALAGDEVHELGLRHRARAGLAEVVGEGRGGADGGAGEAHDHVGRGLREVGGDREREADRAREGEGGDERVARAGRLLLRHRVRPRAVRLARAEHDGAVAVEGHDGGHGSGGGQDPLAERGDRGGAVLVARERPVDEAPGLARVRGDEVGAERRPDGGIVRVHDREAGAARACGERLEHHAVQRAGAVVGDDLGVDARGGLEGGAGEGAGVVAVDGSAVHVVDPHDHLVVPHDARLRGGAQSRRVHEAGDIDAGREEQVAHAVARGVLADEADHAHGAAEAREVHGGVRGAAERLDPLGHVHDGRRRLAGHAVAVAAPPLVEDDVADDRDRRPALGEEADDPAQLAGHRASPSVDSAAGWTGASTEGASPASSTGSPRCTTVVVLISSSSSGP